MVKFTVVTQLVASNVEFSELMTCSRIDGYSQLSEQKK